MRPAAAPTLSKPQRQQISIASSRGLSTTALLALVAILVLLQPTTAFLPPVALPSSSFLPRSFPSSSPLSTSSPLRPLYGSRDDDKALRKVQQSKRQLRVARLLQSTVADVIRKVWRRGGRD